MSLLTELGQRHKTFVSYHHAKDQYYRDLFEAMFDFHYDIMLSQSVQIGDIDPNLTTETVRQKIRDDYLRDSTVTVVLIGSETWRRKHVDWEIGSSVRDTQRNPRSGLLGIVLPTYPRSSSNEYNPYTIPPRLAMNIQCGYAKIYNWSDDPNKVQRWIHEAFNRRKRVNPDNSYPSFVYNRSGETWL